MGSKISIQIEQLPSEKEKIPVELRCEEVELLALNELEKLPCEAVNNTAKDITALVVTYVIEIRENEKDMSQSGAITTEALLHPDFYKLRKDHFIHPNEVTPIELLPTTFPADYAIRGIKIKIDYVEFEDGSAIGKVGYGYGVVNQIRQGVAIYRNWLRERLKESKKSETAFAELLQNKQNISKENLGDLTFKQIEGAKVFQKFIREIYSVKGMEGVNNVLKK